MKRALLALFLLLVAAVVHTSHRLGHVGQGQVVAYDAARGVLTLVEDSNYRDPAHPRFDVLPAITVSIPADRSEMGPAPQPGKLLRIDRDGRKLFVFDSRTQAILTIPYIEPDLDHRTITIYSPRDGTVTKAGIDQRYVDLPDDTWQFGDEVRYSYKDPGQALRLMNVTRTEIASLQ